MPKSRVRKRQGRPVTMHRPGPRALVAQRAVASLCDDLDDLLRAVPASYDGGDLAAAVEHHHAATAVVAFLRHNDVVGILAAMGGGDMVAVPGPAEVEVEVVEDEGAVMASAVSTPTLEADIVQSLKSSGVSLDMAGALEVGAIGQPRRTEGFLARLRDQVPVTGGLTDPTYPCRVMETRGCPPIYEAVCGDRPCARFESEDETPWRESYPDNPFTELESMWLDYNERTNAEVMSSGGFATDTATLERIRDGLSRPEQNQGRECTACRRHVALFGNGRTRRHKDRATGKWCVGS